MSVEREQVGAGALERAAVQAVERALEVGAAQADAYCVDGSECTVRVYEDVVENLTEAGSHGIGVRALTGDGRSGYAYGSDLGERGLAAIARAAHESATVTDRDESVGLPDGCGRADVGELSLPDFGSWSAERKVNIALAVERAARGRDPLVSNVEDTVYSDEKATIALANSAGFCGSFQRTQCYAYSYAFAGTGSDLMTGVGVATGRDPGDLDAEAIGHEAADRALQLHGAEQPSSRRCPVVLDSFVAAHFAAIVGSRLSAEAVQRGRSLFAGKEGEPVASKAFGLLDDGTAHGGLATQPFDDEGSPTRATELVQGGNLKTYLFDSRSARRVGRESTGSAKRASYRAAPSVGCSNLIVEAGDCGLDDLIARAGDGVYVTAVKGLHSGVNAITGQFSVGATGRLIEGGVLGRPLRGFTIASDLLSMLAGVVAAGSEARWLPFGGSVRSAPLLIAEMAVAGS